MAKIGMIYPFSGRLCEECSLYRGRHYFLCFCEKYRGYLDGQGNTTGRSTSSAFRLRSPGRFEIPYLKIESTMDPFDIIIKEGKEG